MGTSAIRFFTILIVMRIVLGVLVMIGGHSTFSDGNMNILNGNTQVTVNMIEDFQKQNPASSATQYEPTIGDTQSIGGNIWDIISVGALGYAFSDYTNLSDPIEKSIMFDFMIFVGVLNMLIIIMGYMVIKNKMVG